MEYTDICPRATSFSGNSIIAHQPGFGRHIENWPEFATAAKNPCKPPISSSPGGGPNAPQRHSFPATQGGLQLSQIHHARRNPANRCIKATFHLTRPAKHKPPNAVQEQHPPATLPFPAQGTATRGNTSSRQVHPDAIIPSQLATTATQHAGPASVVLNTGADLAQ